MADPSGWLCASRTPQVTKQQCHFQWGQRLRPGQPRGQEGQGPVGPQRRGHRGRRRRRRKGQPPGLRQSRRFGTGLASGH